MRCRPRIRRAAVLAAAALVAGRGPSGSGRPGTPGASGGSGAPAGTTPRTAHDPGLGTIVTDSAGFTLYRFDQDGNPPESYCNGNCATLRAPEQAHGNVTAEGVDGRLFGTVTRSDGTEQATVNGSPAYRFSKDPGPGAPAPMPGARATERRAEPMAAHRPRPPPPMTTDGG
ncbi:hypothetical protein ACFV1W_14885 [Kitasatospora sp. NPDC059648]|uniref:hypothetical protein n=1 Tax=Kitasatospora sp. NPDC059648 TaxID=3346894 RepID=UPI0036C30013